MYCRHCGKTIEKDSTYCSYCGKPLHEKGITKLTNKISTKRNFCIIFLFVFIAVSVFFLFHRKKIADITINQVTKELTNATEKYDELHNFHEGLARVCKNGKYGFIDKLGNEIIPCKYDYANDFEKGISIVEIDEKRGGINQRGKMVIPCIYDYITSFEKDSLTVASINDKSGIIDLNGNVIIPFNYEDCGNFCEGLAYVRKDGLLGFVNKKGELVIPCQYSNLYSDDGHLVGFSEGLVGVFMGNECGYIDRNGNIVIPFQEELVGAPFSSGLSYTYKNLKDLYSFSLTNNPPSMQLEPLEGAFIYKNGQFASDFFKTDGILGFKNGYCKVRNESGWEGLMDSQGKFTIPCKYSFINNNIEGKYALIGINHKIGVANKATGEITIPIIYDDIGRTFEEGIIPVKKDGKYGYINEYNEIIIPFSYDYAGDFSEGFAIVKRYGKYGYIDRFGHDTFH